MGFLEDLWGRCAQGRGGFGFGTAPFWGFFQQGWDSFGNCPLRGFFSGGGRSFAPGCGFFRGSLEEMRPRARGFWFRDCPDPPGWGPCPQPAPARRALRGPSLTTRAGRGRETPPFRRGFRVPPGPPGSEKGLRFRGRVLDFGISLPLPFLSLQGGLGDTESLRPKAHVYESTEAGFHCPPVRGLQGAEWPLGPGAWLGARRPPALGIGEVPKQNTRALWAHPPKDPIKTNILKLFQRNSNTVRGI